MTANSKSSEAKSLRARSTVWIMRDGFQPDQLNQIKEALTEDGNHCVILDRKGEAPALPKNKLLLVAVASGEASNLVEVMRSKTGGRDVPLLVYFNQTPENFEKVFGPEIDDFLFAPLSLRDLRLRVKRLTRRCLDEAQPVTQCLVSHINRADVMDARQRLLVHLGAQQFVGSA